MQLIDLLDNGETVCKVPDKYGLRGYSFTASWQVKIKSTGDRVRINDSITVSHLQWLLGEGQQSQSNVEKCLRSSPPETSHVWTVLQPLRSDDDNISVLLDFLSHISWSLTNEMAAFAPILVG